MNEIQEHETVNRAFEHYIRLLKEDLDSDMVKTSPKIIIDRIQKHADELVKISQDICSKIMKDNSVSDAYEKRHLFRNVMCLYINDLEKSKDHLEKIMDKQSETVTIEDELESAYTVLYEWFHLREADKDAPIWIDLESV